YEYVWAPTQLGVEPYADASTCSVTFLPRVAAFEMMASSALQLYEPFAGASACQLVRTATPSTVDIARYVSASVALSPVSSNANALAGDTVLPDPDDELEDVPGVELPPQAVRIRVMAIAADTARTIMV